MRCGESGRRRTACSCAGDGLTSEGAVRWPSAACRPLHPPSVPSSVAGGFETILATAVPSWAQRPSRRLRGRPSSPGSSTRRPTAACTEERMRSMAELPHPWGVYARLQIKLAHRRQVDDRSWGLDAGLDRVLAEPDQPPTEDEIDRAVRSEGRRERYRAQLRRVHLAPENCATDPEAAVAARQTLRTAQAQVAIDDWMLLCAVGEGCEYGEIAAARNGSPGQLRVRVLRLRRKLTSESSHPAAA